MRKHHICNAKERGNISTRGQIVSGVEFFGRAFDLGIDVFHRFGYAAIHGLPRFQRQATQENTYIRTFYVQ